jgi:hypothetical protein
MTAISMVQRAASALRRVAAHAAAFRVCIRSYLVTFVRAVPYRNVHVSAFVLQDITKINHRAVGYNGMIWMLKTQFV